jgi:hypothetical protein
MKVLPLQRGLGLIGGHDLCFDDCERSHAAAQLVAVYQSVLRGQKLSSFSPFALFLLSAPHFLHLSSSNDKDAPHPLRVHTFSPLST